MEVDLINDYSPEGTHLMFLASKDGIPQFEAKELIARISAFHQAGYREIGGVLVSSWQTSVQTVLNMHELASNHLQKGALIGPYCFSYGVAVAGVKIYRRYEV